jgi:RNA polymerase sigma factor (sigma-70 family)
VTDPSTTALTDELLALRCQLGERAAFDALVERWHDPLWRYIRSMCDTDDSAAETLQDTWLRILRSLPRLRQPDRLRAWLFGIARRAVMDRLRRQYVRAAAMSLSCDVAAPEPEDWLDEDIGLMHEELRAMPLVEREVLVLFYLRELPSDQVADVLDVPVGTVKSRLFRARRMLRARLEQRGLTRD